MKLLNYSNVTYIPNTLILLIMVIISHGQWMQVHDISSNTGVLTIREGKGRILVGYNRLLHVVELSQFEISIKIIENAIGNLNDNTGDFSKIILSRVREIKTLYESLRPKRILRKRSIEMLGSAIKFITGNLDTEDLRKINRELDTIKMSYNNLTTQNNRQVRINSKFQNRLNLINEEIRSQENIIKKIALGENLIITDHVKVSIIFQLNSLLRSMQEIEETLTLSKLNVVNRKILAYTELITIANELKSQNLEIDSLDEVCSYLTATAFYRGPNLIFSINVPRVSEHVYERTIIEPLPHDNITAQLSYTTIFVHQEETLAVLSKCPSNNHVAICNRNQIKDVSKDGCLAPMLKGSTGKCITIERPPKAEIKTLAIGTILLKDTTEEVILNNTCGTKQQTLGRTTLITFFNCSIIIENQVFENYETEFKHPIITPLHVSQIERIQVQRHVNVSQLQEMHIKNRQLLENLEVNHRNGTIIFAVVSVCLLAILLTMCKRLHHIKTWVQSFTGRETLGEGAVNNQKPSEAKYTHNAGNLNPETACDSCASLSK